MVYKRNLGKFGLAVLGALALGLSGCGGADFGSELSARPKPRKLSGTDTQPLHLPRDVAFSIVFAPATKDPGLGGDAKADATASRDGSAAIMAAVTESGSATAEFKLGHAFENDTARQVDLVIAVSLDYEYTAVADESVALPDAFVGLKLYATDRRNRTLRSYDLVRHSTEKGGAKVRSNERIEFSLVLAPGASVNVYLAGLAKVAIKQGRSASGSLEITGVQMEAATRPAPPVRTAADEQG